MNLIFNWIRDVTEFGLEKIGRYYSTYRGYVYDNADPKTLGRLIISCPDVYGEQVPNIWAFPSSVYAGKGYGAHVIPQKNDLIWITFQHGNPRKPLWSHGHYTTNDIPVDLQELDKYWFRSPGGYTILFDDKNKTITLFHKDGTIEPMVLGDTLQKRLEEILELIKTMKINTQLGPQGILPIFGQQADKIKDDLAKIKSQVNKLS